MENLQKAAEDQRALGGIPAPTVRAINKIDRNPKKRFPRPAKNRKFCRKILKKRGMGFIGPTIIYAYMQAVGLVDNHVKNCFRCLK